MDNLDQRQFNNSLHALRITKLTPLGTVHSSVVCVRKDGVRAYVDGRLFLTVKTTALHWSIEDKWKLQDYDRIGIGAFKSVVEFQKIQLKELSAKGETIAAPTPNDANGF